MIISGRRVRPVPLAAGCAVVAGLLGLGFGLGILPVSGSSVPAQAGTVKAGTVTEAGQVVAVKDAFTQAVIVNRQLGNPLSHGELRLRPVPAGTTDLQAAGGQGVPSVADRQLRMARDRKNISAHFASAALLARENHNLGLIMAAYADPNTRVLGDGVSDVVFTSVTVSGNTATVVARAHEWTNAVTRQQAGGNWLDLSPAADTIWNGKLSRGSAGTWLVTEFVGGFASGSGP